MDVFDGSLFNRVSGPLTVSASLTAERMGCRLRAMFPRKPGSEIGGEQQDRVLGQGEEVWGVACDLLSLVQDLSRGLQHKCQVEVWFGWPFVS